MKKKFNLRGGKNLTLGDKTLVMGILNVTPDSFSDGGKYLSLDAAKAHAEQLISDGADILDVGAESTRPDSKPVSVAEEITRLEKILPAIKNLDVPISIDTYKPEVAEFALERGFDIINDVYGLEDSRMAEVGKKFEVPVIVGHSGKCCDENIIDDIKKFFRMTLTKFKPAQIIFDVGIGFGKTQKENLEILRRLDELKILDGEEIPLMIGVSRKSFIGWATGFPIEERDEATGAICVHAISKGVDIVRVHNVKMISKMCRMADRLLEET